MSDSNESISIRIQEKFEFYFLSLTFVLLGLAIQTAKFGDSSFADSFELLGWLSLLISGLTGLSRMEWTPCLYKTFHEKQRREEYQQAALRNRDFGHDYVLNKNDEKIPIGNFIEDVASGIESVTLEIKEIEGSQTIKYLMHKYGFVSGILALFLSRGQKPIFDIADTFLK